MKNNVFTIVFFIIGLLCSFMFINAVQNGKQQPTLKKTADYYQIKAIKLPKTMSFAGEQTPMEDLEVRERLDREMLVNTYWQSNMLLLLKRANKTFDVIEPILVEEGVPDDFKYLAVVESSLLNKTSPVGAKGVWQIMSSTALELGLEVNDNVDERYHLEKSTRAACQYLKSAYQKFGSWTLAAAAYNAGISGITKSLKRQHEDSYYNLYLNSETARYVPRILAVKEIMTNPLHYGFIFDNEDLYTNPKYYLIEVKESIADLASFAKTYNMTYKELKILNPWLRDTGLKNSSLKTYHIKIKR